MSLLNFAFAHLGASVAAASALELAGYTVFSKNPDDNPLVLTTNHKTPLYSYIVLLDVMSKSLVQKATQASTYPLVATKLQNYFSKSKEVSPSGYENDEPLAPEQ
jgi:hypothetical protein